MSEAHSFMRQLDYFCLSYIKHVMMADNYFQLLLSDLEISSPNNCQKYLKLLEMYELKIL